MRSAGWEDKLLFIFLTFLPVAAEKLQKNATKGAQLPWNPPPTQAAEGGYRVFFVSQRRSPAPTAERLGAHRRVN